MVALEGGDRAQLVHIDTGSFAEHHREAVGAIEEHPNLPAGLFGAQFVDGARHERKTAEFHPRAAWFPNREIERFHARSCTR